MAIIRVQIVSRIFTVCRKTVNYCVAHEQHRNRVQYCCRKLSCCYKGLPLLYRMFLRERESSLHVTNTTYSGLQQHRIIVYTATGQKAKPKVHLSIELPAHHEGRGRETQDFTSFDEFAAIASATKLPMCFSANNIQ
jgi:hypothetical protein